MDGVIGRSWEDCGRWIVSRAFLFLSFFCGEGLSEIILCSRISWLCLKPLLFIYPPNIWKPMKCTLKITCYCGLSRLPCLYKQLRINGTLLNLCSDSGAGGGVWWEVLSFEGLGCFSFHCSVLGKINFFPLKIMSEKKNNVWHLVT